MPLALLKYPRWYNLLAKNKELFFREIFYFYFLPIFNKSNYKFEKKKVPSLFPGCKNLQMAIPHEHFLRMSNCKLLCYLSCRSRGMNFNFPQKKGTGIERLLPHCTQEAIELIYQMCTYDPDERITAKQAIRHPYFKDLRSVLKTVKSRFSFMQMFSFFSLFF